MTVLIFGGGITGMSAAKYFEQKGIDYLLIEKDSELGGLLRPLKYDQFSFDRAVHLSFGNEVEVRKQFDSVDYISHNPESFNWNVDRWLRHPVQDNLLDLPFYIKLRSIFSLLLEPVFYLRKKPHNYKEWLYLSYGKYFSRLFPVKYTIKYWCYPPEDLDVSWLGPRMRRPNFINVIKGAFLKSKSNTYYVKEMRYPSKGTYFEFIRDMVPPNKVLLNSSVVKCDTQNKKVYLNNGSCLTFSHIVSTIPLPSLMNVIASPPANLLDLVSNLEASKIMLVSYGFNKIHDLKSLWFYIYDEDIYASRCYSPSIKSPANCPQGCSSLQFEIYGSRQKDFYSNDKLMENCRLALCRFFGEEILDSIVLEEVQPVEYGNVIFKHNTNSISTLIKDYLHGLDIYSAGRFGEWGYLWSHQSFMSGLNAARRVAQKLVSSEP